MRTWDFFLFGVWTGVSTLAVAITLACLVIAIAANRRK